MTSSTRTSPDATGEPILDQAEAARRKLVLAELQAALAQLGTRSVLAGNHRLVLRYNDPPPQLPSGPTNPALHILAPGRTRTATTDGTTYQLDDGQHHPASDPAAAATAISHTTPCTLAPDQGQAASLQ
jgi:hypothetical protein